MSSTLEIEGNTLFNITVLGNLVIKTVNSSGNDSVDSRAHYHDGDTEPRFQELRGDIG